MSDSMKGPVRYRRIDLREADNNPDLHLISDYLSNDLDPAQVAQVRRRLEEDPTFRDFAAPIIAFWEAGRDLPPTPRSELVTSWNAIKRDAMILRQQRKRRKWLWFGGGLTSILLLVVAIIAFVKRPAAGVPTPQPAAADTTRSVAAVSTPPTVADTSRRVAGGRTRRPATVDTTVPYKVITDSDHDLTVLNGLKVRLDRGATLRVPRPGGMPVIELDGAARFVVPRPDPNGASEGRNMFIIRTRGGLITAAGAPTFRLTTHGDTTMVTVEGSSAPPDYTVTPSGSGMPQATPLGSVLLSADPRLPRQRMAAVQAGETAQIIRGGAPVPIGRGNTPATRPLVRFRP